MSRPTVAIISINYAPEKTGIAVYTTGLAEYLHAAGWDATVHTGFPYYPAWKKARDDYGKLYRKETVRAVLVKRSYLYVPHVPSALRRIAHEASFVASALATYVLSRRADLTIVVSPPLPLGPLLLLAARARRSRTLFHVQDLQPDAALELGLLKRGVFTRVLYALERITYRLAHRVSTISLGMQERIAAKGVPRGRLMLLRNWANDSFIRPVSKQTRLRHEWGLGDRFVVLYAGNLGLKQGLRMLLEAAAVLRAEADIAVVIVGDGAERRGLEEEASRLGLRAVRFESLQPLERLGELLATADVSVIPQKVGVTDIVLPSKLANIMASARPLVAAAAAESELATIVRSADCGHVVAPGDASAMARAILALKADPDRAQAMGENGRRYMESHFTERAVLGDFERAMREWVGG